MRETRFRIEATPVPASRPQVARFGTYYPEAHTRYESFLRQYLSTVDPFHTKGPVELHMTFVMPRYKTSKAKWHRADVDNLAKLPMDTITKAKAEDDSSKFWLDDSQVVRMSVTKRFTTKDETPHTIVIIKELPEDWYFDLYPTEMWDLED